ncbi:nitroreductase family protein [Desulfosediminicola flagellatus]|uniref:nitroreductase family protein n=1 Tax=Desulfosediminicola flagellatus TaxID=2569541 RepID=UPI0010ACD18D|nr:nitroreductase family protein [Desulfosediminicola flagellatus]
MNECINVILKRGSVRNYTEQTVYAEQLELLARAAMAAPSAANKQPWEFIIITDHEKLNELAEKLPYTKMTKKASAAMVVCGNINRALADWEQDFWIQDCSAATQNILLAAEDIGLGAVWTGVYPSEERVKIVSEILALPKHLIPLNLIPVGYPVTPLKYLEKFDPTRIHWNSWEKEK